MAARFADHPEAVAETERLAETLEFDLTQDLGYRYPGAEDDDADRAWPRPAAPRFEERYPRGDRTRAPTAASCARRRASGSRPSCTSSPTSACPGFFNLHHELLELAREVAREVRGPSLARQVLPPGRGRGSSVSSIVCYLTGLSHVDPVENELLLGRFLNEEITSLPDIDLDFPRDVREVLLPRVHDRYGRDRAALVAAFPTYRRAGRSASSARRSACRRGRSSAWRAAPRAGARRRATTSRSRSGERRGRAPGRWALARARWPTRPTACRATSPSTPAG